MDAHDPASEPSRQDRALAAPVLHLNLDDELAALRAKASFAEGQATGTTLVKEPNLRVVLMAVPAGGGAPEHTASGPISVQPLRGQLQFQAAGQTFDLGPGQLLALEANVPHSYRAAGEETAFLLSIGRTTYSDVSDHHEPHDDR